MNTPNMNIHTSKLLGLIICFGGAASAAHLQAQNTFALPFSLAQGSPATTFSINTNGTLIESGPLSSSVTLTLSGAPQMVWFPGFGAFRAGTFSGSQSSIGQYSAAFGLNTVASGQCSLASGAGSSASGLMATALGNATASGTGAFAAGYGPVASGYSATALGGMDNVASGQYSFVAGLFNTASGNASTALGQTDSASGNCSVASGNFTQAGGNYSVATGFSTIANSQNVFVIGQYNAGLSSTGTTPSASSWVSTDPLLELGNGTSSSAKSDAVVMYKNGSANFQGVVTVAAGGDIPMYNGN